MAKVYASGPISDQNYEGATNWYTEAQFLLRGTGISLIRPMRGKEFLATHVGEIGHRPLANGFATSNAIAGRDKWDTVRADAVLMYLNESKRVSMGCMIEAGWSSQAGVPIVLCAQAGNVHEGHVILEQLATYRATTLEEACDYLRVMFWDD